MIVNRVNLPQHRKIPQPLCTSFNFTTARNTCSFCPPSDFAIVCEKPATSDMIMTSWCPFSPPSCKKKQQPAFGWKPASFLAEKREDRWRFGFSGWDTDVILFVGSESCAELNKPTMVIQNDRTRALLMTWLPPEWLYHFPKSLLPPKRQKTHPLSHFSTKSTLSFPSPKGIDRNNWGFFPLT